MDNARLYVPVRDYPSSGDTNLDSKDENHKYNWYLIEDNTSQGALSPSASMAHNFPYYTVPICLGSTICILGGSNLALDTTISSDFWYFDINNAGSIWSKGPCMHVGRSGCFAIAAGEKVYAFGGRKQWYVSWGEVYDMRSNEWSQLIPPHKNLLPATVGGGVVWSWICTSMMVLVVVHARRNKNRVSCSYIYLNLDVSFPTSWQHKNGNLSILILVLNGRAHLWYQLILFCWS